MSSYENPVVDKLIRWGGIALIVSGVCVAAAYLLHPPEAPPETVASGMWIFIHGTFMVSLLGGVFGMIALMIPYIRGGGGMSGVTGFAMGLISLIFIFGLDYSEVFIFPTMAVEFPPVIEKYGAGESMPSVAFAFPLTGLLFMVGFLLFGYQLYKSKTMPASASFTIMLGVVIFAVGLSGFVPMLVVKVGAVIFGAGLALLGKGLLETASA